MSDSMCLPKDDVLDRIQAMMIQEDSGYNYEAYFPPMTVDERERRIQLNVSWREKICQWSYNVVDHFDLPREIVAISLDIFDRYLATRGNECSGNLALLTSLTTLHIAIKIHSDKSIKISTLASLSRGQFGPKHIEQMEWQIFSALGWKLHPPTLFSFISHLLMIFPNEVHHTVRKEIFEVAIYMAELSVCDSYFVRIPASAVALASIINVMEDLPYHRLSHRARDIFWGDLLSRLSFDSAKIQAARDRLKAMFVTATPAATVMSTATSAVSTSDHHSMTSSPTSTTDMHVDETASLDTINSYFASRSEKSYRSSSLRRNNTIPASPMARGGRSRRSASPILGFQ